MGGTIQLAGGSVERGGREEVNGEGRRDAKGIQPEGSLSGALEGSLTLTSSADITNMNLESH